MADTPFKMKGFSGFGGGTGSPLQKDERTLLQKAKDEAGQVGQFLKGVWQSTSGSGIDKGARAYIAREEEDREKARKKALEEEKNK